MKRGGVLRLIESQGPIVCEMYDLLTDEDQDFILESISDLVLDLCQRIERLVVITDTGNDPDIVKLPPVLPLEMCKLSPRAFYQLLGEKNRLGSSGYLFTQPKTENYFKFFKRDLKSV